MKRKRIYSNRVLDRTFRILETLAQDGSEVGITEISAELDLHKSTVHRLLAVLESSQLVERSAHAKYRLGWKIYELGLRALPRLHCAEVIRPHLERLVQQTGETARVGILRQGEVISIVNCESRQTVGTPATLGGRSPAHGSSPGKVLLAGLCSEELDDWIAGHPLVRFTKNTITDPSRFRTELALVAKRGYAMENEETEEGLFCIAAPVRDHSGAVIAAISIAGPVFRMRHTVPDLIGRVTEEAVRLCGSLGYRPQIAPLESNGRGRSSSGGGVAGRRDGFEGTRFQGELPKWNSMQNRRANRGDNARQSECCSS